MELVPWFFTSGILGVLVGALLQYYLNRHLKFHELELKARSDLYLTLFSELRDLNKSVEEIHSLICNAQVYASDEIIDILHKFKPGEPFDAKLLWELLVAIRKELRPNCKNRSLKLFFHRSGYSTPSLQQDASAVSGTRTKT
jgi:hypothetical protein